MKIKEIVRECLKDEPLMTLDRDTLGEMRVQGHRLSVSNVLGCLSVLQEMNFAPVREYGYEITDDEVRACCELAADFIHKVFCDAELFPTADLDEFVRLD